MPFENVTRAPDMDWLEDASVNLLYLDMSKWRDIKVIDDERVADLIRDVPEAHDSVARQVADLRTSRVEGANFLMDRTEIALKRGAWAQAVRLADSLRAITDSARNARSLGVLLASIVGKTTGLASLVENVQGPPWVKQYFSVQIRSFLGLAVDSLFEKEAALAKNLAAAQGTTGLRTSGPPH